MLRCHLGVLGRAERTILSAFRDLGVMLKLYLAPGCSSQHRPDKKVPNQGLTAGVPCATIGADVEERTCEPSWAWRDPGLFCCPDKKVAFRA